MLKSCVWICYINYLKYLPYSNFHLEQLPNQLCHGHFCISAFALQLFQILHNVGKRLHPI